MKLNARQVDTAKPREKAYQLADGAGLYLEVVPSGSRYWRMKYRFNGKRIVWLSVSIQQCRLRKQEHCVMTPRKSWLRGSIHLLPRKKKSWFAMCNSTTRFSLSLWSG